MNEDTLVDYLGKAILVITEGQSYGQEFYYVGRLERYDLDFMTLNPCTSLLDNTEDSIGKFMLGLKRLHHQKVGTSISPKTLGRRTVLTIEELISTEANNLYLVPCDRE